MNDQKQLIKAINDLTKALNKNTDAIKENTELSKLRIEAVESGAPDEPILLADDDVSGIKFGSGAPRYKGGWR